MTAKPSVQHRKSEFLWLAILLIAAVGVRVFALGADPLHDTAAGFITDWGDWVKNARLHALWGRWTMDDSNVGLYTAFGYTLAVRLSYALLGEGLAQSNLVSAISGLGTVLAVYAVTRRFRNPNVALLAAALVGINPLMIPHDRSSYPESFQLLFIVLAVGAILTERWWIAGLGGIALAVAIACKVTGLVAAPAIGLVWLSVYLGDRFLGLRPAFSRSRFLTYGAAAAALLLALVILFVVPHWADISREIAGSSVGWFSPKGPGGRPDRVALFGFRRLGLHMNGFFWLQWYLVFVVGLFAAARLTRSLRQPVTQLEVACWSWLGAGGLALAVMYYQPDRRFLFLVPPLAILAALFLGHDIVLEPSRWRGWRRTAGFAMAGALLGGLAAFYVSFFVGPYRVMAISARMGHPLDYAGAAGLLVTLSVLGAAFLGLVLAGRWQVAAALRPSWLIGVAICAIIVLRWGYEMKHRSYTLRRFSVALGRLTESWPEQDRVMLGGAASTLAMGTRIVGVSYEWQGLPAAERFQAPLAVLLERSGIPFQPLLERGLAGPPARADCAQFPVWPSPDGTPRFVGHLLIASERLDDCRRAFAETAPPP